ncbi:WbqC family protein, partial [Verrucomicrobiota bacterium]
LLEKECELLVDLNNALMAVISEQIGLKCGIVFTEDMDLGDSVKNERVIRICREVGADTWLANSAGRDYIDPALYDGSRIKVVFQDFDPPVYKQQYEPFVSHLSVIDMIFNCGSSTLELIRKARESSPHYE